MSRLESLFQSFEGAGSIYVSNNSSLSVQSLKKLTSKAIIVISRYKRHRLDGGKLNNLQLLDIKTDNKQDSLSPLLVKASNFIAQAKKYTNIIVWSPQGWQLGVIFVFAHLILKYGHTLQYILHLYDKRIKNILLPEKYLQQLKNITENIAAEEIEVKQEIDQTGISKRILRIRKDYPELGKDSHMISQIKKLQTNHHHNPQKERKKVLLQSFQTEPFMPFKRKLSTNLYNKTARDKYKSNDI